MQRVQRSFRAFSNVCTYIFLLLKMKREIGTSVKIIKRVKIFLNHHQSAIMLEEADKFHQLFFIKVHYFKQNPPGKLCEKFAMMGIYSCERNIAQSSTFIEMSLLNIKPIIHY